MRVIRPGHLWAKVDPKVMKLLHSNQERRLLGVTHAERTGDSDVFEAVILLFSHYLVSS
jgi:hypothetical protein